MFNSTGNVQDHNPLILCLLPILSKSALVHGGRQDYPEGI